MGFTCAPKGSLTVTMSAANAAAASIPADALNLGSTAIQPAGVNTPAEPAGTLHLVDGWEPLCGGDRVRFVFPGRQVAGDRTCPACVQATLPKPRTAARPAARPAARSRARAS